MLEKVTVSRIVIIDMFWKMYVLKFGEEGLSRMPFGKSMFVCLLEMKSPLPLLLPKACEAFSH